MSSRDAIGRARRDSPRDADAGRDRRHIAPGSIRLLNQHARTARPARRSARPIPGDRATRRGPRRRHGRSIPRWRCCRWQAAPRLRAWASARSTRACCSADREPVVRERSSASSRQRLAQMGGRRRRPRAHTGRMARCAHSRIAGAWARSGTAPAASSRSASALRQTPGGRVGVTMQTGHRRRAATMTRALNAIRAAALTAVPMRRLAGS